MGAKLGGGLAAGGSDGKETGIKRLQLKQKINASS